MYRRGQLFFNCFSKCDFQIQINFQTRLFTRNFTTSFETCGNRACIRAVARIMLGAITELCATPMVPGLMTVVMVSYEEYKRDNKHQRRNRLDKSYDFYGTLILVVGATENLRARARTLQSDKSRVSRAGQFRIFSRARRINRTEQQKEERTNEIRAACICDKNNREIRGDKAPRRKPPQAGAPAAGSRLN